jgi:mannitol/fructose-specific phosphotransferase system IIA component (Ntr-type)
MKLSELLSASRIRPGFDAPDKWTAIRALVALCVQEKAIPEARRDAVVEALVARENIASTGLDNGVALPHATVDKLDHLAVALAVSPQGVPFESADGQPARILVLVVIPRRAIRGHVRTLATIARLLEPPALREAICKSAGPEEILAILRREEDRAAGA